MRREDFERPRPPSIDRPSDRWVCGHADHGSPCAHGPDANGVCSEMATCRPFHSGDAWNCTRPACFGGKCGEGPASDGRCGQTPQPCTPRRSWRFRRRRLVLAGTVVCLVAWTFLLAGSWRSKILRPGMLSQPHAQILGSQLESRRCAACHPAAEDSLLDWFSLAGSGHRGVTQSQLCVDCHHTTFASDRALMAHNLTLDELNLVAEGRSRWHSSWRDSLPRPAVDLDHVHCAACHREHHGADANLTLMTNGQCQTCHQDRFQSFATDHPDWQDWPYRQEKAIAFDHVTHYGKHFAATIDAKKMGFQQDCRTCHEPTVDGEVSRLTNFETSCAACHEDALQVETSEGITLLAIPSLPASPEPGTESWPEAATGFYDGRIDPLTRLLISDQGRVSNAISNLSEDGDLAKTDVSDAKQRAAANEVAAAVRQLMDDLAIRGNAAIVDRLHRHGVPEAISREIARQLPPQLVYDARERWFGQPPRRRTGGDQPVQPKWNADKTLSSPDVDDVIQANPAFAEQPPARDSEELLLEPSAQPESLHDRESRNDLLLDDEPLGETDPSPAEDLLLTDDRFSTDEDPLLADPLTRPDKATKQKPADDERSNGRYGREDIPIESLLALGGWFQDDRRLAIRYRAAGHADPVLRSVVDLAVALPPDHPVRQELLSQRSTASCVRCHRVGPGTSVIRWDGKRTETRSRRFTKFSHQPHLHLDVLENCTHCHEVRKPEPEGLDLRIASFGKQIDDDPHQFEPLQRQTCIACHTADAAGDSCTKCHRYHVDPMVTPADPR